MSEESKYKEIWDYMDRFKDQSPEKLLRLAGEIRDFGLKYMLPEGRRFFEGEREKKRAELERMVSE